MTTWENPKKYVTPIYSSMVSCSGHLTPLKGWVLYHKAPLPHPRLPAVHPLNTLWTRMGYGGKWRLKTWALSHCLSSAIMKKEKNTQDVKALWEGKKRLCSVKGGEHNIRFLSLLCDMQVRPWIRFLWLKIAIKKKGSSREREHNIRLCLLIYM